MPKWLVQPVNDDGELLMGILILRLVVAFLFGCIAAAIHFWTSAKTRGPDRSFLATLVMLSILIAVVTIVIGVNVARAFSLAGVLAIVRFRTVVDDTRDTAFVIFAVVSGMAVGGGFYWEPALVTPLVLLAAWMFRPAAIANPPSHGQLVVRLAAGRPADNRIDETLRKHIQDFHLVGLSTARGGSALDAVYAISLPAPEKIFALVNDLSRIEGVQGAEIKDE